MYSGAVGAANGSSWNDAYTTLAAALTAKAAGDDFWVADDHAETQASAMTLTAPGTAASPNRIICVRRSGGSVPPASADLRTTATVSTTGNFGINLTGRAYCYGITFAAGNSTGTASLTAGSGGAAWGLRFEACALRLGGSGAASRVNLGSGSGVPGLCVLVNTTVQFGAVGQKIQNFGYLQWLGTASAVTGATLPTTLMVPSGSGDFLLQGVDLSALGSGKNLIDVSASLNALYSLVDCKLGSSVTVTTGSVADWGATQVRLVNCDSGNTNYRYYKQTYQGSITHESVIVRSGGATDGTTTISRKMVTTANAKFYSPLESDWMPVWIDTTGSSKTITICVVTDNVTLTDAECWVEVEYLGTSGFPLGSFASDAAADALNAGTNQTTDTSTWTTTGLGTPVKQQLSKAFTPQVKGLARARVCLAKASTTVYFDPLPVVT